MPHLRDKPHLRRREGIVLRQVDLNMICSPSIRAIRGAFEVALEVGHISGIDDRGMDSAGVVIGHVFELLVEATGVEGHFGGVLEM